ncbi:hypothetical protein EST38_g6400 [Candolleomyces aberdarensis]|uniref:Cytochrome P450 n=1 Tax=Candolleomyces aberdarensis TaxID=2316362 RepID=A0A4Q2DHQ9_9AGAR|nr:hypothetical protein EST38_g6400 [Candolleomyces aberdarensis]
MWDSFIALSLGLGFIWFARTIVIRRKRNPRGLPLPPGPKGLPLLGNVFQFPQANPWEGYHKLCEEYGDMVFLTAPGLGILVLGSHRRAVDLLDKRSANYSERPTSPIVDLMDLNWSFGLMPYGSKWREHNRTFHKYFSNSAVQQYYPIMYEETKAFLCKVNSQPNDIFEDMKLYVTYIHIGWRALSDYHARRLFGAALMRVAYGIDDNRKNKVLVDNGATLASRFSDAVIPGRFLVSSIPALRHVPSWFPGAGFKKTFEELAHISYKALYPPFEEAKSNFAEGASGKYPSIAADLIDSLPEKSDANYVTLETIARSVCAVGYVSGAETTVSSATALLYVLASYPEIYAKAQAEIDAVIGSGRLPLVTDREGLPYVHAIVKEVGRWYTVVPLGVAHAAKEDDEYDDYFIPKRTIILQNNWAMMHDPDVFDKPFEFVPERYIKDGKIDPSVPDTDHAAFGHGRR